MKNSYLELQKEFLNEASLILEDWEFLCSNLEKADDKIGSLISIFRITHTLKASSFAVGFYEITEFAQIVEELLARLIKCPQSLTAGLRTMLLECGDKFRKKIEHCSSGHQSLPTSGDLKKLFLKCELTVRELSLNLGKRIELVQFGTDIEIERSIVENLTGPLLHLIRNAVDHGIQTSANKTGRIFLAAEIYNSNLIIHVQDDGNGIDSEKVLKKAKEIGLVDKVNLTQDEIFNFIFLPGFSTAEKMTKISGYGIGLDVVRTSVKKLNGAIKIDSKKGHGTRIQLFIPLLRTDFASLKS